MQRFVGKAKSETRRIVDQVKTAYQDGTLKRESERVLAQVNNTVTRAGEQIAKQSDTAVAQTKEASLRYETREQREKANACEQRCEQKIAALKTKLPTDYAQDNEQLIAINSTLAEIKTLAEKIRSRPQAGQPDYAFAEHITHGYPLIDCKAWLVEQLELEKQLDGLVAMIESTLAPPVPILISPIAPRRKNAQIFGSSGSLIETIDTSSDSSLDMVLGPSLDICEIVVSDESELDEEESDRVSSHLSRKHIVQ